MQTWTLWWPGSRQRVFCSSAEEHRSAESECLKFDATQKIRFFFFLSSLRQDEKSFSTPFELSNFTIRLLTYKSWNRYIRYVLCGKVDNGWDKVVLDDNTTDGPPIGCLLSKQQTDGFQCKFDCWRWVTHGTNLDKMLFLDRLYGCKGRTLSLSLRIIPYCVSIFLQ